jgi:predicted RNA methylase
MIRYEATPAKIILELVYQLQFTPQDLFIDLGSGLGLVVILVHLLTGTSAMGIEYDPVYCAYARARAVELGLTEATFLNADARRADLSNGSIFYLFTPFIDEVFEAVIEKLRRLAKKRPLYICSYGTCTIELAKLPWLQIRDPAMEHDFKLAIFSSQP